MRRVALASFGALSKKKASLGKALRAHRRRGKRTRTCGLARNVERIRAGIRLALRDRQGKERINDGERSEVRRGSAGRRRRGRGARAALRAGPGVVTRRRLAYRIDEKRHAISERGRAMRDTVTGRRTRLAEVVNG
jgi:hypothetical protein